ncbi:hypothetical protein DAEQUDRAFT_64567 [Daedalea quercina L-15889]|uniref:Uncharacterized protein n=1 Tax=Daedalea quercina L-15889 TaxID=1314783 RepID=A0A165L8Y7_9APHY|nr:hypothetical protein DAEQUDRAFT_64567 [Daedalea quercina L-15889]
MSKTSEANSLSPVACMHVPWSVHSATRKPTRRKERARVFNDLLSRSAHQPQAVLLVLSMAIAKSPSSASTLWS